MGLETEAKFEALLEVYSGAAFVIDADGRYAEVLESTSGSGLLYDDADALQGQRFHDVLPGATADRFLDVVRSALATGTPEVVEYDLDVHAGHRWFEASVAPVPTDDATDRVLWVARDVTDRTQFQQALAGLHEAGTRLTASESVEAVCEEAIHAAATILEFDKSIIALEEDGVLHAEATSEALPEDAVEAIPIDEGVAGQTYRTGESRLLDDVRDAEEARPQARYRSGLSLPVGDHGTFQAVAREPGAFDEADVELAELLVAQVDASLTQLRHEQALQRRNERLDEFTSIVSHDLQNPLTVARGRLAIAREERDDEHLAKVATAHERMQGLIDDLLTLARTGDEIGDRQPVELPQFLRRCWNVVETSGATLEIETDRTIRADPNRLQQLFENLLGNAVDHGATGTGSGSRPDGIANGGDAVTITVGDVEDGIYVADDGPGVPDEAHDRLFEQGFSTSVDGTGLGLHIVETIADSHGWAVSVTDAVEGGARFELTGIEAV